MATWTEIFPGLEPDPVRGRVGDYDSAATEAGGLAATADEIQVEFARITSSADLAELKGQTADQLVEVVDAVDGSLSDVAPLFDSLKSIFVEHASRLREFDTAAASALARANTRWLTLDRAESDHIDGVGVLASIDSQLWELRSQAADPAVADRIDNLADRRWRQQLTVNWQGSRVAEAEEDLAVSRAEYDRFVADESALVAHTVLQIKALDLHALKDPGRLHQFASDLYNGVTGVADWVIDGAIDGLQALAEALLILAEFVFVESLRWLAMGIKVTLDPIMVISVLLISAALEHLFGVPGGSSGDLGGTYELRPTGVRGGYVGSDGEQGRQVIIEALRDTADGGDRRDDVMRQDEFQIIRLENGKYIVVLPGVIDLSSPYIGLDPGSRSARDTDQHALPSASSAAVADNVYAQMVMEAMRRQGVPHGSDVMFVGHSFGADTALDLASDSSFNGGPAGYNVTHVVAAAYDSAPQLPHVASNTEVLVLQNNVDVPVLVEHGGRGPVGAFDRFNDGLDSFIDRDPGAGFQAMRDAAEHAVRTHLPTDQLAPGTAYHSPTQAQVVFVGGYEGVGHHQKNYIDYLEQTDNAAISSFSESIGAAGYGDAGTANAVDISVLGTR